MITGLLDEGRFHKLYPLKELYLTGIIFGQIIINQLIENKPLQVALNIILDSVKQKNKQLDFGQKAIEQLKEKKEWLNQNRQFCEDLFHKDV